jgi:N-acetylglucosamine kinase-like BadF-type ATPase
MRCILGIDQGSTKTHAALCDQSGRILAVGHGPGAYHLTHGLPAAIDAVRIAAEAALQQAEIAPGAPALLFAGLTGADWPDEYLMLQHALLGLGLAAEVRVVNDSIVALRGGSSASHGAILIAGTGGNCAIRGHNGETFIYHFYHDIDLQGGWALGRRALRAIYRSATGREPPTLLSGMVLAQLGLADVDGLLRADSEARLSIAQIAALGPLLFEAACADDGVATAIIRSFGLGLAELVAAGLLRMNLAAEPVEVVLSGSVFKGPGTLLQQTIAAGLAPVAPAATLVDARYEPVVGALLLGLEALGWDGPAAREAIEDGSRRHGLIRELRTGR